ncbi:hypothetical protein ACFFX0_00015 [Citricoccus parietis]|uniref:Uncharacterized protein n=1 Tax=Citricoccus parietis TaxID=592307 RepID=A0ABV5FSL0_9MICC
MTSPSSQPLRAATDHELFTPSGESVVDGRGRCPEGHQGPAVRGQLAGPGG